MCKYNPAPREILKNVNKVGGEKTPVVPWFSNDNKLTIVTDFPTSTFIAEEMLKMMQNSTFVTG